MREVRNATDVRRHWGQFNDDVVREGSKFVKRNRDRWAALSYEHLKEILSDYTFKTVYYQEDDESITISLNDLELVENAQTKEVAINMLTDELTEYAHEYLNNFNLYFHSPNRRKHMKLIMNVLVQDNEEDVEELIECRAGEV